MEKTADSRPKNRFSRGDLIVMIAVAVVLAASLLIMFTGRSGKICRITADGQQTVYSLETDRSLTLISNGYTLFVEIRNGEVTVTEADCPDRVCVRTGKISRAGQSIICVPAKIVIEVTGGEPGEDLVAG